MDFRLENWDVLSSRSVAPAGEDFFTMRSLEAGAGVQTIIGSHTVMHNRFVVSGRRYREFPAGGTAMTAL